MPISATSPIPTPADVVVLGSGTFETTTNGVYQDAGSFTTPGDLGNDELIIVINSERQTAVTNNKIGWDLAAGNSALKNTGNGTAKPYCVTRLRKDPFTLTTTSWDERSQTGLSYDNVVADFTTAKTVYIKAYQGTVGANKFNVSWIAYLIKG